MRPSHCFNDTDIWKRSRLRTDEVFVFSSQTTPHFAASIFKISMRGGSSSTRNLVSCSTMPAALGSTATAASSSVISASGHETENVETAAGVALRNFHREEISRL